MTLLSHGPNDMITGKRLLNWQELPSSTTASWMSSESGLWTTKAEQNSAPHTARGKPEGRDSRLLWTRGGDAHD